MRSFSNEKKWKYLSFVLMGVLATGFFIPSAFGTHRPGPKEIWEAIDSLQSQINSIEVTPGPAGEDGADGQDGLHCWDLNGDGVNDAAEDINGDGVWNTQDCKGPQGEPGADAGALSIYKVSTRDDVGAFQTRDITASCNSGDKVTGGGFSAPGFIVVYRSEPTFENDGWIISVANGEDLLAPVFALALCADLTP